MTNFQVYWISFAVSVIVPFIFSLYFFFSYRRQRRQIIRLQRKEWTTLAELDRKELVIRHNKFIARISLSVFMVLFLFSLIIAAKFLKLF